jgi:hypothetical protein
VGGEAVAMRVFEHCLAQAEHRQGEPVLMSAALTLGSAFRFVPTPTRFVSSSVLPAHRYLDRTTPAVLGPSIEALCSLVPLAAVQLWALHGLWAVVDTSGMPFRRVLCGDN